MNYRYGTSTRSRASSALSIIFPARSFRRRCGSFFSSLCCFQPPARLSFPDAVRFRRLAAPRFVFIFGIELSVLWLRLTRRAPARRRLGVRLGAQDDVQHPSLEPGIVLGVGDVLRRLDHLVEHLPAELRVRHLAALEAHRDLRLVSFLEEAPHVLQLEVEVKILGIAPHFVYL